MQFDHNGKRLPVTIDDYLGIEVFGMFTDHTADEYILLADYVDARCEEAVYITIETGQRVWASDVCDIIAVDLGIPRGQFDEAVDTGRQLREMRRRAALTPAERQAEDDDDAYIDEHLDELVAELEEFDPTAQADWDLFWEQKREHEALKAQFNTIIGGTTT
jgi:hypothetical protein